MSDSSCLNYNWSRIWVYMYSLITPSVLHECFLPCPALVWLNPLNWLTAPPAVLKGESLRTFVRNSWAQSQQKVMCIFCLRRIFFSVLAALVHEAWQKKYVKHFLDWYHLDLENKMHQFVNGILYLQIRFLLVKHKFWQEISSMFPLTLHNKSVSQTVDIFTVSTLDWDASRVVSLVGWFRGTRL